MWEEAGHGEQDALLKAEMLQQIQNAPEDARRKSRIRRLSWWAAAACVAGLSTAFFMLKQDKAAAPIVESRPANAASSEIRPGRQQAMLTLADGTVVELDSASNGLLGQQGKTRVTKLANGQLAYQQQGESTQPLYNTMRTPRGGQYQVLLPDGTKAWLNAASSLTYPVAFLKNERRVKVTGEVYFEVAAGNPHAPFIVEVTGMREQPDFEVKVLGTTFNINAYEDEGPAEATLLSGAVVLAREGVQVGPAAG
ncbi:FecR family protein [Chitinophaga sedimenti]|uniref:FecR family protein n=1 Tax=Chitinophaga sedimenti TaxID=2033606 RepID=UPI0020043369|nr:FecR family protein [Chitinophaga sedimenti]MCK7553674.1 FecR family protein [Chitinophaga sedimenti]